MAAGRGGERERERGDSGDEITPINETEGSLMGAGGNGVRANGGGRRVCSFLINVKGTAGAARARLMAKGSG